MDTKHSFLKGMNRDVSKDKFPTEAYYYLLNGRILTDDNATMSDIINLKSNTDVNIDDVTNGLVGARAVYTIIGYTTIQNDIILFYASNNASGIDSDLTQCVIDILEYKGDNEYLRVEKWIGPGLNFRLDKKIRAVARYESSDIKKIYWSDNNEAIRHANIGEDISTLDSSEFDFIGDFYDTPRIHLESYTSGSIKQGIIYYAYRFVKINGYKTIFSQLSDSIPIARNIAYGVSIGDTKGDDIYDEDNAYNTGKGVRLKVSVNNTDYIDYYDYIEVISLWHSSKESIPDINIVNRLDLITDKLSYTFIDEGTSNYGSLEYSQLLEQQNSFKVKDLIAKDNRLFVGNITEEFFDLDEALIEDGGSVWDARAYRFGAVGNRLSELLNNNYSVEYTLNGTSPNYSSIDETADCINKYNKITTDIADEQSILYPTYPQKYQSDGVTLGGSGLNLKFDFYIGTYYTASLTETSPAISGNIENDVQLGIERSFQRDEVYRFGIVFFDRKGRQSFVKWIADIRMLSMEDTGAITSFNITNSRVDIKTLFPQITIINPPSIGGEKLDWQIVYVKREESDKSIVYAAMLNAGMYSGATTRPSVNIATVNSYTVNSASYYNQLNILAMSPDIVFKKTEYLNIDFIHAVGGLTSEWPITKLQSGDWWTWNAGTSWNNAGTAINIHRFPTLAPLTTPGRVAIVDGDKAIPPTSLEFSIPVGVDVYKHSIAFDSGGPTSASHGTGMVYRMNGVLPAGTEDESYYGYGRRIVYDSQYGGQTYENRTSNTYIPAGRRDADDVSSIICTKGDIFITLFEYLKAILIPTLWGVPLSNWVQFVCESSINTTFRHDDVYSSNFYLDNEIPTYINEDVYIDADTGLYFQELYKYNFAYSNISQDRKFFSKPLNFVSYEEQITKVKYSDVKIDTEDHDSWLSFRTNNYNNAHNNYGPINRLVNFYDKVFSFQDNALSLISINPRVTQQSEDGVTITLGTGSVIDKFNYLTTNIGCQDNSDVIKSFSAMYWLDKNKKKIYTYNGKIQSVTDLKGMHSYLKNNVYEDSYFIGTYDIHNSEVIMTLYDDVAPNSEFVMLGFEQFKTLQGDTTLLDYDFVIGNVYEFNGGWFMVDSISSTSLGLTYSHGDIVSHNSTVDMHIYMSERDNFTLAYNEKIQAFTSFYSFIPSLYISHNRDFFSTTNDRDLYQHNIGSNFNEFYGTAYPLQLKLISNYGSQLQGEYTNFKYFMSVEDTNGNYQRNESLTNIHSKNEYQSSSDIILYPMHLPNDADRTKYILDTSSTKIGVDWYSGLNTPDEGIVMYNNQLYRNNSGGILASSPGSAGWDIAELANIRKTVEHWLGQMPRYDHRDAVYDSTYLTSDRLRSNWLETTFEFRSVLEGVNIEERKIKISDITLLSNPMLF